MAKKLKRVTAALCSVLVAVCLSGCGSDTDKPASEATDLNVMVDSAVATVEYQPIHDWDYSEFDVFPEDWSSERMLNMISVDGIQLSFPCTVDELLAQSDKFSVQNIGSYNTIYELACFYYDGKEIGNITYTQEKNIFGVSIDDFNKVSNTTIDNIPITDTENMRCFLDYLQNSDGERYADCRYFDNNYAVYFSYGFKYNSISMTWEELYNEYND